MYFIPLRGLDGVIGQFMNLCVQRERGGEVIYAHALEGEFRIPA
jgi:hypothetical protein